jgi:hypothetical protein
MNKIDWKELVILLKNGQVTEQYDVVYTEQKIDFKDAALLNRYGYRVPENLVSYNDDEIDFSDDADLTEDEIVKIETSFDLAENLAVEQEIKDWLKREKIDINMLAAQLIRNFYETMKNIQNNAAL